MRHFCFNKDNKNDIVNRALFGKIPHWQACIADYLLLIMIVLVLAFQFSTGDWWGLATGCIAFGIGFSLARWVF